MIVAILPLLTALTGPPGDAHFPPIADVDVVESADSSAPKPFAPVRAEVTTDEEGIEILAFDEQGELIVC